MNAIIIQGNVFWWCFFSYVCQPAPEERKESASQKEENNTRGNVVRFGEKAIQPPNAHFYTHSFCLFGSSLYREVPFDSPPSPPSSSSSSHRCRFHHIAIRCQPGSAELYDGEVDAKKYREKTYQAARKSTRKSIDFSHPTANMGHTRQREKIHCTLKYVVL